MQMHPHPRLPPRPPLQARPTPARFIDRADTYHLAFGHGICHCLGAPLARAEGQLALGSLLHRFAGLRLAVAVTELHWDHGDGLVVRGLSEPPVIPGQHRIG